MIVVPVAFDCQAYYRLIQKFGFHNLLLWVSIVITALLGFVQPYTFGLKPLVKTTFYQRAGGGRGVDRQPQGERERSE